MIKHVLFLLITALPLVASSPKIGAHSNTHLNTTLIDSLTVARDPSVEKVILLSIDGGGVHSLIPLIILAELEKMAGKPCHDIFTFYAGVSAGSVVTALLNGTATCGAESAELVVDRFEGFVKKLFQRPLLYKLKSGFGLLQPVFEGKYKDDAIDELYGKAKLSDLKQNAFFLATDVNTAKPHIFGKTFNSLKKNEDFHLSEIINASTATPVFFPSVLVQAVNSKKMYNFIDGGIARNDMGGLAIELLQILYPNAKIHMLSLGAREGSCVNSKKRIDWGLWQWVFKCDILSIIIKSATVTTSDLLTFQSEQEASALVNYVRIESILPPSLTASFKADPSYIEELRAWGKKVAEDYKEDLQKFLDHL